MNIAHSYQAAFALCATAMYRRGLTANGHLLSAVAAKPDCPPLQLAHALAIYRTWLATDTAIAKAKGLA